VAINEKLDSNSEMLVLTSHSNTKNIILVAVETRGPLDEPAFELAVEQLMTSFPPPENHGAGGPKGAKIRSYEGIPAGHAVSLCGE